MKRILNKKFNIKNLEGYQKLNLIVGLICLFFVLTLSIGYAYLSQNLGIDGRIVVQSKKDIRITNITNFTSQNGGYDRYNPTYTPDSITTNIVLPNLNSQVSYTVTIVNNGSVAMDVKSIVNSNYSNSNIVYSLNGISQSDVIAAGQTVNFTITFSYNSSLTAVPSDNSLGLTVTFEFAEHTSSSLDYISGGKLLDLRGTDAPTNNTWVDEANNHIMTLSNVSYNSTNKYYDFSNSSSYATLGQAIIPTTGDFTLEARIVTPSTISTSADEAVIAQISDTNSKDTGRIKLDLLGTTLLSFVNRQNPSSTNAFYNFATSVTTDTTYVLQLVRDGENLKTYLNGVLVTSNSYPSSNTLSSGIFKFAKWTNSTLQHYDGKIQAVRLYNKALTADNLLNNYQKDEQIYSNIITTYDTVKDFAVGNYKVTSGEGLYDLSNDQYVYRGTNPNNYLKISGSNDVYRILSFNSDNTMKILDVSYSNNIAYDDSGNRNATGSTYCTSSSTLADGTNYYGCNAWNSADSFTNTSVTGSVQNDSSSNTYLNTTYYNSLASNVKNKILSHAFATGVATFNSQRDAQRTQSLTSTWTGKIGLLSLSDIMDSSINDTSLTTSQTTIASYLTSLSNSTTVIWTMTGSTANTYDVFSMSKTTLVGRKRASRTSQQDGSNLLKMYVYPSFYINSNVQFTGTGTADDPFIIS